MAAQKTRIIFVLDRSGSTSKIAEEMIGGFNSFVRSQQEIPGEATMTLVQFDDEYLVSYRDVPVEEVPELTAETFVPRGMTALYDAIGRALVVGRETNDPEVKTIVAILTDGEENASREFEQTGVKNIITNVQNRLGWEVLFIGANIDVQKYSNSLGLKAGSAVRFDATMKGASDAMTTVGMATSVLRGVSIDYGDGEVATASNLHLDKLYKKAAES